MKTKEKQKNTWRKVNIDEVVDIIDGDRGVNYPAKGEFTATGSCLFLNTKNVPHTSFDFSTTEFISEERDKKLRKGKLQRGDFVLTTRGTVGNVAYYGKMVPFDSIRINSGMVILRPKTSVIDPAYMASFLTSTLFRSYVGNLVSGSAQPQLPIRDLRTISLNVPPLATQKRIGQQVQIYSQKIENNNTIIKTLEETAQAIFKEWFMHYRFPGHEKAEFVDSEMGRIPKGWEIGRVGDAIRVVSGYPFSSTTYEAKGLPVVTIKNVQDGHFSREFTSYIPEEKLPQNMNKFCMLNNGDILLSLTGNVGRVCFVHGGVHLLNQRVARLMPVDDTNMAYTYFLFRDLSWQQQLITMAKGSAQPNLSPVEVGDLRMVLPSAQVLEEYRAISNPFYNSLTSTVAENQKLVAIRDMLLPRLMSGEIEI